MAASSSSSPFFGIGGDEDLRNQINQQQHRQKLLPTTPTSLPPSQPHPPPLITPPLPKKKRNQPGTPYPDAEVIALSPKTLMATNRFICEVCNKGFQREQNLQLHRRGHNLPWKLKQKSTKEVRRRVYLCPEPTCVHHDPSRALGDLTGIKKHFCRKHGEKKWKCDKCSKRYAVQSDWKAHSKTCGTREYRCDCGTLFSRRDSFITHRAFCDALAQESARIPSGLNTIGGHNHLYGSNLHNMGLGLSNQINSQIPSYLLGGGGGGSTQLDHMMAASSNHPSFRLSAPTAQAGSQSPFFFGSGGGIQDFNDDHNNNKGFHHGLMHLPDLQTGNDNHVNTPSPAAAAAAATFFNLSFFNNDRSSNHNNSNSNNQQNSANLFVSSGGSNEQSNIFSGNLIGENSTGLGVSSLYNNNSSLASNESAILPQMSATALLQKAAQMGATTTTSNINNGSFGSSSSTSNINAKQTNLRSHLDQNEAQIQALMSSLASGNSSIFGTNINNSQFRSGNGREQQQHVHDEQHRQQHRQEQETCTEGYAGFNTNLSILDDSKLHQNLSIGSMGGSDRLTRDFLGVGGMVRNPLRGHMHLHQHQHQHQHGLEIDCLNPEMKSAAANAAARSYSSDLGGSLQ